jgi:PAS domain S-box-containing protein
LSSGPQVRDGEQGSESADLRRELERLREIEQRFEDFANSARDFAFITLDLDNRIIGWNKGAEQLLGYSEAEILGRSGSVFFTPEDVTGGECDLELATARAQGRAEDDRWHMRKDGSRFWASGVMTLLRDQRDQMRGYAKVMRDHTAQRRNIEALRASEERFRLLVENVRDCALFSVDLRGNVSDWNPGAERIFGYSAEQVLGRSAPELLTKDEGCKALMTDEFEAAAVQDGTSAECWMVRQDGSRFYARWVTNAIRDELGHAIGFMKVLRDETERRRAEEERELQSQQDRELLEGRVRLTNMALHRTKEELQDLAGQLLNAQDEERRSIARDLHDHLAQRLALVEMKLAHLRGGFSGDRDALLSEMEGIQGHIAKLSTDVRDLSHRLHPSTLEHIGLLPALTALIKENQSLRKSPIQLDIADFFDEGLKPGVRSALYRISEEALRNVQRHAGDVAVTLTLYRGPEEVHLQIQDEGPGFSHGALQRRKTLGLISMEERARLVGGTLELTSLPGEGTAVKVLVPLKASQADGFSA